eukprot:3222-Eustigmatos_ZCMA.PRE.1
MGRFWGVPPSTVCHSPRTEAHSKWAACGVRRHANTIHPAGMSGAGGGFRGLTHAVWACVSC